MKLISLALLILLGTNSSIKTTQNIKVEINGIRSGKGDIILSAFKTNEQFDDEEPVYNFNISKDGMTNGTINTSISLPIGKWGVTLLDDENLNDEMDYNFIRIPEEGFGFSNYYLDGLSKPDLQEFSFKIDSLASSKIKIKIRYM